MSDAITDLIHLAEEIHDADYSRAHEHGSTEDETDTRRLALRTVETACAHYLAEAHAVRVEPEGDADGLGGYVNPNVRIAQADDGEELYAAACPSCGTLADIDGYCVDAGCSMVGKAVS